MLIIRYLYFCHVLSRKYYPYELDIYWNWIFSNKSILDLCRRPSLMHMVREMLPYLFENKTKEFHTSLLPNTAGETINLYIEYWINRQESKNIQSAFEGKQSEKKEFLISFFSELAVELNLNGKFQIESDEVLFRLRKKIEKEKIKGFERKENLEGFENEILTGYFIEIENNQYRFVHNSFFEYFVAIKIIESISKRRFKEKLIYSDWSNEIVDFVYDTIPIEFRQHGKIPALILLGNSKLKARLKFFIIKWSKYMTKI